MMYWGRADLAFMGEIMPHVYWSSLGEGKGNLFILMTEGIALARDLSSATSDKREGPLVYTAF